MKSFSPGENSKNVFVSAFFKFQILHFGTFSVGRRFSLQNIFHFKNFLKNILEREIFSRFPEKFQNVKFENVFSAKLAVFYFPTQSFFPWRKRKVPKCKLFSLYILELFSFLLFLQRKVPKCKLFSLYILELFSFLLFLQGKVPKCKLFSLYILELFSFLLFLQGKVPKCKLFSLYILELFSFLLFLQGKVPIWRRFLSPKYFSKKFLK